MVRLARFGFAIALIAFGAAAVGLRTPATGADSAPSTDRLNKVVDNVAFTDAGGKASALKDHAGKTATAGMPRITNARMSQVRRRYIYLM